MTLSIFNEDEVDKLKMMSTILNEKEHTYLEKLLPKDDEVCFCHNDL